MCAIKDGLDWAGLDSTGLMSLSQKKTAGFPPTGPPLFLLMNESVPTFNLSFVQNDDDDDAVQIDG